MKDYSQLKEQEVILRWVKQTPGSLLDMGAFHPEVMSNSRALIEMGWSGVLVDVSPTSVKNLVKFYAKEPRVQVIQGAITLFGGLIEIEVTDDAVSTSSQEVAATWRTKGGYYGKMLAAGVRLPQLLDRRLYDFINIDVEGQSADLFIRVVMMIEDGSNGGQWPSCFCVEHDGRAGELWSLAHRYGYTMESTNGTNIVLGRPV